MSSSGSHFCVQWNNHQKNLLSVMSELLQKKALTDVTLGVDDGRSVECHKMILAACSSYFQTLFTQYPCKHPFVVLAGVKYPEIMRIVEFMYKGEVNVAQDELDDILKVAEVLQIKGLIEANDWTPEKKLSKSSIDITSDTTTNRCQTSKNSRNRRKTSSPNHSTSKLHENYEETSTNPEEKTTPWPEFKKNPLGSQDSSANSSSSFMKFPSLLETHCEKVAQTPPPLIPPRIRKRKMSRESVISRKSLIRQTDEKEIRNIERFRETSLIHPERNVSIYENPVDEIQNVVIDEREDGQNIVDLSFRYSSRDPQIVDDSIVEDEKKSRESFSEETKTEGIASLTPTQQTYEGKRYKKYSRNDLSDAIHAVKEGMSANRAAVLFKVPSRTLYDKIKKLGYTNPKQKRIGISSTSSTSCTSACFPYGIGGNVDGSIYGNIMEYENENSDISTEAPINIHEASYIETRYDSMERENVIKEIHQKSQTPQIDPRSHSPIPMESIKKSTEFKPKDENEAEDLSVTRKSEIPGSIPSKIVIKDET